MKGKGGIKGKKNTPTTAAAGGMWNLREHHLEVKAAAWPAAFSGVTDSLVLRLDASDAASYSGSGTTWTNLGSAGSGANGTLVNAPTYSTSGGGSLVFNGSNQYINCAVTKTANCTFSCWAKTTSLAASPMLFIAGPNGSGPDLFFYSGIIAWNSWDGAAAQFAATPATVTNGNWHLYTVVTDTVANNTKLYYDGSLLGSTTYKSAAASTDLRFGGTTDTYMWNGGIGLFTINNIALTAEQVLSNYNGQKSRFA